MAGNTASAKTIVFIKKMQNTLKDLHDEFELIDDPGVECECPLVRFMDLAEKFYSKEVTELIDEDSTLFP